MGVIHSSKASLLVPTLVCLPSLWCNSQFKLLKSESNYWYHLCMVVATFVVEPKNCVAGGVGTTVVTSVCLSSYHMPLKIHLPRVRTP